MRSIYCATVIAVFMDFASANEVVCIPRSEMGETIAGEHLYERDADLKIRNLSRFDFAALTVTSAEGVRSKLVRVEPNVFKTTNDGTPYYFVTNNGRSMVTELSVRDSATYVKVLLCK